MPLCSVISRGVDALAGKPFPSPSGRREDGTVNAGKSTETITLVAIDKFDDYRARLKG
jgi:hypothetical protein